MLSLLRNDDFSIARVWKGCVTPYQDSKKYIVQGLALRKAFLEQNLDLRLYKPRDSPPTPTPGFPRPACVIWNVEFSQSTWKGQLPSGLRVTQSSLSSRLTQYLSLALSEQTQPQPQLLCKEAGGKQGVGGEALSRNISDKKQSNFQLQEPFEDRD